ncbi:MAG TPA: amidase [Candidatus Polarisedimenticolia bacterium]|nr:amidase [Candidatus Polarisedimenticolia bacterium]
MVEPATPDGDAAPVTALSRRRFLSVVGTGTAAFAGGGAGFLDGGRSGRPPGAERPTDLTRATASQLADLILRKKASSLEVVDACLARIAQVNPKINAVVQIIAEQARTTARAADNARAGGGAVGPLHGVPMTLKDSIDTAGVVTTGGTMGRKAFVPADDATVVTRLKGAGAILLGKSNTPEFTWAFETSNPVYGRTNNPWGLDLSPGGSSGGAAAIVAACGVPFDIGSDTGGSIRVPAHFCGVAGIKPTSGRVPRTGHIVGMEGHLQSLTQLGPLARSVDDLTLILGVIAGPDWRDAAIVPAPLRRAGDMDVRGLRVAMHLDNGLRAPAADVARVVSRTAEVLQARGAHIEERRPEALSELLQLDDDLYRSDGGAWLRRALDKAGTKEPGPDVARSLVEPSMTTVQFTAFTERWDAWRGRMLRFLETYDAILCPPCALDSLPHQSSDAPGAYPAFSYTFAYNMTGWPAAVVRAGTSLKGLPLGVQIVGRPWREDVVLALAREVERALGGYQAPPI